MKSTKPPRDQIPYIFHDQIPHIMNLSGLLRISVVLSASFYAVADIYADTVPSYSGRKGFPEGWLSIRKNVIKNSP